MRPKSASESTQKPKCPVCGAGAMAGTYFPFCSERCKLVDLGRWLDGDYSIEVPADADDVDME